MIKRAPNGRLTPKITQLDTRDFANGEACIKAFGELTCDQYGALTAPPMPCENACKPK
jgi:hypothetical protein